MGTGVLFQYFQALLTGDVRVPGWSPANWHRASGGRWWSRPAERRCRRRPHRHVPEPGHHDPVPGHLRDRGRAVHTLAIGSGGTGSQTQNFTGLRTPSPWSPRPGHRTRPAPGSTSARTPRAGTSPSTSPSAPGEHGDRRQADRCHEPEHDHVRLHGSDVFNVALGRPRGR